MQNYFRRKRIKQAGSFQKNFHTLIDVSNKYHRSRSCFFFLTTGKRTGCHIIFHDLNAIFIFKANTCHFVKGNTVPQTDQTDWTDRTGDTNQADNSSRTDTSLLCPECAALLDYALRRLDSCRFGDGKPSCRKCPVHCYRADMRERIRTVMRWAGPRMIFRHPIAATRHLLRELRSPEPAK